MGQAYPIGQGASQFMPPQPVSFQPPQQYNPAQQPLYPQGAQQHQPQMMQPPSSIGYQAAPTHQTQPFPHSEAIPQFPGVQQPYNPNLQQVCSRGITSPMSSYLASAAVAASQHCLQAIATASHPFCILRSNQKQTRASDR
jgi:hypothetical protein